jgi:hypothetical protein
MFCCSHSWHSLSSYFAVVIVDTAWFPIFGSINIACFANEQLSTVKIAEVKFNLNIIPLKSEKNISEWKASVSWVLAYQNLENYITENVKSDSDFIEKAIKKNKIKCIIQLLNLIWAVCQYLINTE